MDTICLKRLKDNYWYAIVDDNLKFVFDINTGFLNATEMFRLSGKSMKFYAKKSEFRQLLFHFRRYGNYNVTTDDSIKGSYVCPELFISLAAAISEDYALKAKNVIFSIRISELENKTSAPFNVFE